MVLDFLFHLTPALGAGYFAICSLVNRTDVIISSSRVRAVSTPLPWWGDRNISTREIYGVTVGKAKAREDGAKFCVMLIDRNGREQEFSRAGTGKEQVEFIGRAIADILNVEFKPLNENSPFKPWMKRINAWAASRGRAVGKMGKAQGA